MPVTTQRFPRSAFTSPSSDSLFNRKSLFSHHNSLADNFFRRSNFGTYRGFGDDTAPTGSRFGVSTRFTPSSSPSSSSSLSNRLSIDRDFRKPPIGLSRLRSNSRSRDLSVDRGYLTTPKQNDSLHSNSNHTNDTNSKRSSSLARSLDPSGADLYEKYSVANYKPKCELSRSRSLTDSTANKVVDSISSNSNSHSASSRAASRERALCGGNLNTRRDSSPVSIGVAKVKTCGKFSGALPVNLAQSRCLYSDNSNNNNNNNKNNKHNNNALNDSISVATITNNSFSNNNSKFYNNNNNNKKSVGHSSATSNNNTKFGAKKTLPAKNCSPSNKAFTVITSITTTTPVSSVPLKTHYTMNTCTSTNDTTVNSKSINSIHKTNANVNTKNELFKRRLGTNPLAPYKNPDFLKCEYDLARSQVINSNSYNTQSTGESKSSDTDKNDKNNNSIKNNCNEDTEPSSRVSSANATDMNKNKISYEIDVSTGTVSQLTRKFEGAKLTKSVNANNWQTNEVQQARDDNMNCLTNGTNGSLDDIKFIDSDDSERKHSPTVKTAKNYFNDLNARNFSISTLPTPSNAAKMHNDVFMNKYNTIGNSTQGVHHMNIHIGQQRSASPSNAIKPQKAIMEDLMSSTSSSTSTLSAADSSLSLSQPIQKQDATVKINEPNDNVSIFARASKIIISVFVFHFFFIFLFFSDFSFECVA